MLVLTDTQRCAVAIAITDRRGNPAAIEGVPAWSTSDPTVLMVTPSGDGRSAVIAAAGPLGTVQVNVTADANLDPETTSPITGTLDVQVVASAAVAVGLAPGTPEENV